MRLVSRVTFAENLFVFRWGEQVFMAGSVWRVVWRRPGVLWVIPDYIANFAGRLGL